MALTFQCKSSGMEVGIKASIEKDKFLHKGTMSGTVELVLRSGMGKAATAQDALLIAVEGISGPDRASSPDRDS